MESKKVAVVEEEMSSNGGEIEISGDGEARATASGEALATVHPSVENMEVNEDNRQVNPDSSPNSKKSEPAVGNQESSSNAVTGDQEEDDDCQIIESPSSSKSFRLKQTRVHNWVRSPGESYKDNPSFKYGLPAWVDKFKDYFDYVKNVPSSKSNEVNAKQPIYLFRCRNCVGEKQTKGLRVVTKGNFLLHLKAAHKGKYKEFVENNPGYVVKKLKMKIK